MLEGTTLDDLPRDIFDQIQNLYYLKVWEKRFRWFIINYKIKAGLEEGKCMCGKAYDMRLIDGTIHRNVITGIEYNIHTTDEYGNIKKSERRLCDVKYYKDA